MGPQRESPARARPADAHAWLPVPNVDDLPELEALLDDDRLVSSGQTQAITDTQPTPRVSPAERWAEFRARVPRRSPKSIRRRRLLLVIGVALATAAVLGFVVPALQPRAPRVTIALDGARRVSVETDAPTVRSALREQHVKIGAEDRVTPGMATKISDGLTVEVFRAFPVLVDIDGVTRSVETAWQKPDDLVRQLDLQPDTTILTAPVHLTPGSFVALRTVSQVTVDVDGTRQSQRTPALTVGEFLQKNGVVLRPGDEPLPAPDMPLVDGLTVSVARTVAESIQADEPLPAPEIMRDDPALPNGRVREVQAGVAGVQRVTYEVTRTNGREVGRSPISKIPIQPPVPRIVAVGTAAPLGAGVSESR